MLSFLSDIKNFAVGSVSGSLNRASRWGTWAMGFRGESYDREGRFQKLHVGGLIIPSILVGIATVNPFLGLATYVGGTAGLALLGAVTGFIGGGVAELREGWAARREWEAEAAQERDQEKLQQIQQKMQRQHGKVEKAQENLEQTKETYQRKTKHLQRRAEKIHGRMEKRAEKGEHVEKELQRRAAAGAQVRG